MLAYNTRGTPETAVIDKHGMIRFQEFGAFEYEKVQAMISELLAEAKV
ncbi:MAG: TlpA family protein disulfide reductase [Anderseniella sp.]